VSWKVVLEIDSELPPTKTAILIHMLEEINDVIVIKGKNND